MTTQHSMSWSSAPAFPASARPASCRQNARTSPWRCWSAASGSAAPGTCSATPASARTPTCSPSATGSGRGTATEGARRRPVDPRLHRRHGARIRRRQEDPVRPEDRRGRLVQRRQPLDRHRLARGDRRNPPLHLRLPGQLHRLLQLRRRLPAELPRRRTLQGRCIHPQHWPEDLDYTGKKVVVIGSGATAVTLVPSMAGDAAHVTMLQRSPCYVFSLPALDKISGSSVASCPRSGCTGSRASGTSRSSARSTRPAAAGRSQMRRFLLWQVRRQVGPAST